MIDLNKLKRAPAHETAMIGARVPLGVKARLEAHCKQVGVSVSALVAELVRCYLEQAEPSTGRGTK